MVEDGRDSVSMCALKRDDFSFCFEVFSDNIKLAEESIEI